MGMLDRLRNNTRVVVLQPTPFCNLDCHYCYLPHRTIRHTMTQSVLTHILAALFSSSLLAETITLLWHAGEPMVVPLDFYQKAFDLLDRLNTAGITIIPVIQTNGTRITQQWCDFIKRYHIRIGVSLDGPQHIHDHSRVDRGGKGTFARAMQGVQLLQQHGIEPSILMVLTRYALDYPDEIWHFFRKHRLTNISLNMEEVNGAHTHSSLSHEEDVERYKQFLRRLLELRDACADPPSIREMDTFLGRIHNLTEPVLSQENIPGTILSFDYQGNVATYTSELLTMTHPRYEHFLLGNVAQGKLEDLLSSPKLTRIDEEVQRGVTRCQHTCAYFDFCGGGSPVNKLSEHGTFDVAETLYCTLKIKATLDVVLEHLEQQYRQ